LKTGHQPGFFMPAFLPLPVGEGRGEGNSPQRNFARRFPVSFDVGSGLIHSHKMALLYDPG
ncbi:hypothetical protein, partial [Enterobacter sp.]|uniref:hypothetical protein n=1 Tax=Enterobacter sp. TaxID=42895 RepID=UPI003D0CA145